MLLADFKMRSKISLPISIRVGPFRTLLQSTSMSALFSNPYIPHLPLGTKIHSVFWTRRRLFETGLAASDLQ